jgi:hypothetical protein
MAALNKFIRASKGSLKVIKNETSINIVPESGRLKIRVTFTLDESAIRIVDKLDLGDESNDFTMIIGENLHEINVDHALEVVYMTGDGRLYLKSAVKLDPTKAKDKHG